MWIWRYCPPNLLGRLLIGHLEARWAPYIGTEKVWQRGGIYAMVRWGTNGAWGAGIQCSIYCGQVLLGRIAERTSWLGFLYYIIIYLYIRDNKKITEGCYSEPPSFSSSRRGFLFGTGRRGSFYRLKLDTTTAAIVVKRKWGSLRPNHPGKEPAPGRTPKRIGNSINRQQHKRKMYYPNVYIRKDLLPQGGDTSSSSSLPKKAYI
jgi:hypothetical protein